MNVETQSSQCCSCLREIKSLSRCRLHNFTCVFCPSGTAYRLSLRLLVILYIHLFKNNTGVCRSPEIPNTKFPRDWNILLRFFLKGCSFNECIIKTLSNTRIYCVPRMKRHCVRKQFRRLIGFRFRRRKTDTARVWCWYKRLQVKQYIEFRSTARHTRFPSLMRFGPQPKREAHPGTKDTEKLLDSVKVITLFTSRYHATLEGAKILQTRESSFYATIESRWAKYEWKLLQAPAFGSISILCFSSFSDMITCSA